MIPPIYYTIHDWMVKQLGLKGSQLLVFAYLYAMQRYLPKEEVTTMKISDATGIPARTVRDVLDRLHYIALVDIEFEHRPHKVLTCAVNMAKVQMQLEAFVKGYLKPGRP